MLIDPAKNSFMFAASVRTASQTSTGRYLAGGWCSFLRTRGPVLPLQKRVPFRITGAALPCAIIMLSGRSRPIIWSRSWSSRRVILPVWQPSQRLSRGQAWSS